MNELNEVEDANAVEFEEFNTLWGQKVDQIKREAEEQILELQEKHAVERQQMLDRLEKQIPVKPKASPELLSLKKSQELLVRNKDYGEAHNVELKIKQLEDSELRKWNKSRKRTFNLNENNLAKKHEREMNFLQSKLRMIEDENQKKRAHELEKLLQKYQNIKKGLKNTHHQEMLRFNSSSKSVS
jgi:hypothetical protein